MQVICCQYPHKLLTFHRAKSIHIMHQRHIFFTLKLSFYLASKRGRRFIKPVPDLGWESEQEIVINLKLGNLLFKNATYSCNQKQYLNTITKLVKYHNATALRNFVI